MPHVQIFTIGFTRKSARKFFGLLKRSGTKRIVDVRLNNVSQLAGFAKREDLQYFAETICGIGYVHVPELAPTQPMLDAYRNEGGGWPGFEREFIQLMRRRKVEESVPKSLINGGCLLCSEDQPHQCHRRLVAEYLTEKWGGDVAVEHLGGSASPTGE
ncbi:MAG: hypothetical protein JWM88_664 [Verrucomicrobia bacterium]|nr:hypothetical protein [Verrucomicrobiota bacterium]